MPVYHFTFHAYGSWLPDRQEGYYIHNKGWQAPCQSQADLYRSRMKQGASDLSTKQLALAIRVLIDSQELQRFDLYAAAYDNNHLHLVVAWRDDRTPVRLRSSIKASLTRAMNQRFGKRQWFAAKGNRTKVLDEDHLHQLIHGYLPKHDYFWRSDSRGLDSR